jgi:hypothetical protein
MLDRPGAIAVSQFCFFSKSPSVAKSSSAEPQASGKTMNKMADGNVLKPKQSSANKGGHLRF